jgi:citrate/tricarballylate utilization protein
VTPTPALPQGGGSRLEALVAEAQRVLAICNACRYCEGYCAVFPALERRLAFDEHDVHYLANLCHNCGACLYACQYAPPHEFQVNFPRLMAQARRETYRKYAWPAALGRVFERNGIAMALLLVASLAAFIGFTAAYASPERFFSAWSDAQGAFYAVLPHEVMAGLFGAVFGFVVLSLAMSWAAFWPESGEEPLAFVQPVTFSAATSDAARLKYLDGGGEGCTWPTEKPSFARRHAHHLTFHGFVLCFASTVVATIYHYVFGWKAPYPLYSLPVLLGIAGGLGLVIGPVALLVLRARRDPDLADPSQDGMDRAFILLLLLVGATGLALLVLRETRGMGVALAIHLGSVLAFFLAMPYGKFVHGLYRFAALVRFHIERRRPLPDVAGE